MKVYRGNPAAARNYVEADHARVDDYYLAEGTGLAMRFVATPEGVVAVGALDGDGYEAWVAGLDPLTGEPRGRLRQDASAVRFVEVVVNGPKSWSLAAALHPDIAEAYDVAQDRGAAQIVGWLAEHATTRVGPRGRQVQVPVERIEAVTVRHYTSRAGDPHRHLHLQINARVFAEGKWRGLHTVGVRDSLDALNGIGHAAVMTDPAFRAVLAGHGLSLDPESGEVCELVGFVGPFSARARQIGANIDAYEAQWRDSHLGEEPGSRLRRAWDSRAWSEARPDKVVPRDGGELTGRWVAELYALGYRDLHRSLLVPAVRAGAVDRDGAVETVLSRLGARRSGWNAADIRGDVERLIARSNIVADAAARLELAEDLTARALAVCVPLLDLRGTPEHIRSLTSRRVLGVEADITNRLAGRSARAGACVQIAGESGLDEAQLRAVATLAGTHRLVVIEGAAGAGKTATLAAARLLIEQLGHRLMVVTPTLKAAQVAAGKIGSQAHSAAWLAHQHGYRWNEDGYWTREQTEPRPEALLRSGDLLLVDEAGMLDQDTARALLTIADESGARVAFVGDRHQLPAVGRGGVLDLAAHWADPNACLSLDTVHRFADPEYAELSLRMRTGTQPGAVFDQLARRGQIILHEDDAARATALAGEAVATGALVVADTREQVADLNAVIRDRLVATARVEDTRVVITQAGERIGAGDRVATRRNDYDLGIANRDTWTVTSIDDDGTLHLASGRSSRAIPFSYAALHVELAYCATAYGAQGETTHAAHLALGEHTGAASAYVAMTRGHHTNTAHLVAENIEDARRQWIEVFNRDRADLGPAHAARLATEEADKYLSGPRGLNRYVPNERPTVPDRAPRIDGRRIDGRRIDGRRTDPRRPVEPPPRPWKTPDRGPGIGF